jgi:NAD(P)-dependent dehydrogenase (short-subunit alcohol dehydrogenase family)
MAKPTARNTTRDSGSDATGEKQRELQREQDRKDEARARQGGDKGGKADKAVQAGVREQPEPPLPEQHLEKPGIEAQMALKPQFLAPDYRGSGKLEGMAALVTGGRGSAHLLDYAATKGAIHAFTMSLASNLIDKGIRVNAIAPGPVWTPLNPADAPAGKVAEFGKKSDMKRPAQPEELSPAYVFLAAPVCSSYITGIVLPITGSVGS